MSILEILNKFDVKNATSEVKIQIENRNFAMVRDSEGQYKVAHIGMVTEESDSFAFENNQFVRV